VIEYAAAAAIDFGRLGVLDRPVEPADDREVWG